MFAALVNWCQRLVSRGLKWIKQQIHHHTKSSTMMTVIGTAGDLLRTREDLLLRQKLVVLKRSVKQVQPSSTDRRIIVWLSIRLKPGGKLSSS